MGKIYNSGGNEEGRWELRGGKVREGGEGIERREGEGGREVWKGGREGGVEGR